VLFSIFYLILRGLLGFVPSGEEGREREVEILVLRHQLKVLPRKAGRPNLRRADRALLAAASRACSRASVGPPSSSGPRRSLAGTVELCACSPNGVRTRVSTLRG
jgi:hypothetical protein